MAASSGGMMPPTTSGTSSRPSLRMRCITSSTSGTWLPDRIDRPTTCTASSDRRAHDLRRRQADALVDHLHAAVARAHRDLLGAVGVAVEARLADQQLDAPARAAPTRARPRARTSSRLAVGRRGHARATRRSARGTRRTRARSVAPHSPVVTPALAQAIDGSMTLRPSLAARSSSASAFFTALASRAARQACEPLDLLLLDRRDRRPRRRPRRRTAARLPSRSSG